MLDGGTAGQRYSSGFRRAHRDFRLASTGGLKGAKVTIR